MIHIGIDPGASGAVAALHPGGAVTVCRLSETETDIFDFIADTLREGDARAVLEQVHAMPKQGVVSVFSFGKSYGFCRGMLVASKIPFADVTPAKWQGALGCRTAGDKNVSKSMAQRLFPSTGFRITHKEADAILLAEYCRRAFV